MPIPPRYRSRSGGFTLLELMIVIIIVGIIAGLAIPTLVSQDDGQVLKQSVQTLLAGMRLQEEEALLSAGQRGIRFIEKPAESDARYHYQWLAWSSISGRWDGDDDSLARFNRALDGAGDVYLLVDGREVVLTDGAEKKTGDEAGPEPHIVFYASGDVSDFELSLTTQDGALSHTITGTYEGVQLKDEADDEG